MTRTDWPRVSLKRLVRFGNGTDHKNVENETGPYRVFGSGGHFARATDFLHDGESVLFGRKGTIDKPLYVNEAFWTVDTVYYTVIGPRLVPRWFYYWATTIPFTKYATQTALPSMTAATLGNLQVQLPSVSEQKSVADFLDRETAQIDAMIEAQERLINLLSERHEAMWGKAYRDLLEDHPERQVRNSIVSIVDGPFGSSLTSSHYVDDVGVRVIRLGNIGVNEFKSADKAFIDYEYGASLRPHEALAGDVVMAGLGDANNPLGRACVVPADLGPAIVKADCYRLRPSADVSSEYLAWALSSPPVLSATKELARGTTRARMNTTLAKEIRIVVPPLSLQAEAISRYEENSKKLAQSFLAANDVIALLRERREALIAAAVTGRIAPETGIEYPENPETPKES